MSLWWISKWLKGGWRAECMLNILPTAVGREISNSLSCFCNGSKWDGPDIATVVVLPHTFSGRKTDKKKKHARQLLGEVLIDGDAPGSVSIWTWLTRSHMKHSSLAAIQEWDAHRELGSILFRKAPGERLHRHTATTYFKARINRSPTLPQIKAWIQLMLLRVSHQVSRVSI